MNIIEYLNLFNKNVLESECSVYKEDIYYELHKLLISELATYDPSNITEADIFQIINANPDIDSDIETIVVLLNEYGESYEALHNDENINFNALLENIDSILLEHLFPLNKIIPVQQSIHLIREHFGKVKVKEFSKTDIYDFYEGYLSSRNITEIDMYTCKQIIEKSLRVYNLHDYDQGSLDHYHAMKYIRNISK